MGKWKVAVHDNTRLYQPWEKPYYVLSQGDVYNMKTRKIEKLGNGVTPARREPTGGRRTGRYNSRRSLALRRLRRVVSEVAQAGRVPRGLSARAEG